ncbi:unnamed protein product, partial [Meganyctiphanes norvegica]
ATATATMVHKVTGKDDFADQMKSAGGKLVVVDFFADWCEPCKMIAPKLEAMDSEMSDVVFLKVDVDECEELAMEHQISCMPTFLFFKNGEKVATFSGANEQKIKETIEANR